MMNFITSFRKLLLMLALGLGIALSCSAAKKKSTMLDPVDYVNTLVGSASKFSLSTGNTYPAVARPWGAHFWTPQTGNNGDGWIYSYFSDKIRGIKQVHQPSPWINDYGTFSLMPVTTGPVHDEESRASWFSHKSEVATPYYYKCYLADHDVVAEVTPTSHAALFRLTYPEKDMSYLVADAYKGGVIKEIIPSENKIIGYATYNKGGVANNFKNWFVIVSDTPFEFSEVRDGSIALVGFKTAKGQVVNLKVASSFISAEQAQLNLNELSGKTFDGLLAEGRTQWNDVLGRFKVEDNNIDNLRTFYSCLYRSLLFPRDISEINAEGERVHYSPHNGKIEKGHFFTDTGFWDTFRSLFPLLNLVYPEVSAKVQEGLVNDWKQSGFLPEWASPGHRDCMVGNNSASVVADAYLSGVDTYREYDVEALWAAVTHGAHARHPRIKSTGRWGWEYYDSLGYVPRNVGIRESAARTLEYAYNDWCIYQFGKALGKAESEIAQYKKNAFNYRNLYSEEHGLMVGKNLDGTFNPDFNPLTWGGDFTEGNSLHYTWSVFHDPQGLIDLMGGDEQFNATMDTVFTIPPIFDESYYGFVIHEIREMQIMNMGNYAHGNQPIQHMIYLYDWSLQPWKTQARVREVMDKLYNANFDGYCGDEDNGQTSSWYVFSAMGFYPVCPGSGEYAIGTPLFKKMTVTLPKGKTLVISAPENSDENFYVKGLTLNGKKWDKNFIRMSDLLSGAKLKFEMDSKPNFRRGISDEARPYSFSTENQ